MPLLHETIELGSGQSFRLLQWRENLREVDSILSPGNRTRIRGAGDRWHYHPEIELAVIQTGSGTRFVGDHIGGFDGLDVVLIGSNVPHFWRAARGSSGYAVQWRTDSTESVWKSPECSALHLLWRQSMHGLQFSGVAARDALRLVQRAANAEGLERLAMLFHLLHRLHQAPSNECKKLSHRPFDLRGAGTHQPAIERVVRHVLRHFREVIPLCEVLRIASMSKATFARQFRRHAGRSFSAFVNQVRLDNATRELTEADSSISEAAFASGFNSLSYFNRTFRHAHKCSPKEYRRRAGSDR